MKFKRKRLVLSAILIVIGIFIMLFAFTLESKTLLYTGTSNGIRMAVYKTSLEKALSDEFFGMFRIVAKPLIVWVNGNNTNIAHPGDTVYDFGDAGIVYSYVHCPGQCGNVLYQGLGGGTIQATCNFIGPTGAIKGSMTSSPITGVYCGDNEQIFCFWQLPTSSALGNWQVQYFLIDNGGSLACYYHYHNDAFTVNTPACTNQCTAGTKRCFDSMTTQTCGDYNSDGCTEWGSTTTCSGSQSCVNGTCGTVSGTLNLSFIGLATMSIIMIGLGILVLFV